ncbi:MAG: three-Cys-motif partner protein TcmP [Vicinamibacterales bacterium]
MAGRFYDQPFDEGTKTKLDIFELFAREWLPVFLSQSPPKWGELHLYDFFAGPGADATGQPGSPLRLLKRLAEARGYAAWPHVRIHAHFFDADGRKIDALRARLADPGVVPAGVEVEVEPKPFDEAFAQAQPVLSRQNAAKLIFIDQFGVGQVGDDLFRELTRFPACDFLFFISSSTLHRFADHPAIKQKIRRPKDYYHVHRAVVDYYRGLLPDPARYFLAPFSIKKDANIYGIVFGSGHPRGIDKFLQVAWKQDVINGEADFDIHRDNVQLGLFRPTKVSAFEQELEVNLTSGEIKNEQDLLMLVFRHGVKPQHAEPVLKRLKAARVIECGFRVPQVKYYSAPRPIERPSKRSVT